MEKTRRVKALCVMVFLILSIGLALPALAQGHFWNSRQAYLGQKRPSDTPVIFAPGLLADKGMVVMGRVAFSQDGKAFYYTQDDSWDSLEHARIMAVRYVGHHWEKPSVVNEQFVSPTLSMDGNILYFRQGNMHNVWLSRKSGDGWGQPEAFLEKPFGLYDFMPTLSGNAYVGSDPDADDTAAGSTLVFSLLTQGPSGDVTVKSLGRPLNEPGFNGDLFVAPDESYMIISAKETQTFESELYISFRKPDLTWSVPVSLGPKINDGLAHRWGQYVSPDGKYLFYSHGTSVQDCAIYWVRFDKLLKRLRPAG